MAGNALSESKRYALLRDLERLHTDADLRSESALERFLPTRLHERALDPDVLVVRGQRGAGKSALFHALNVLSERQIPVGDVFAGVDLADVEWREGFSETSPEHPHAEAIAAFATSASDPDLRTMWAMHLASRLMQGTEVPAPLQEAHRQWAEHRADVRAWTHAAKPHLSAILSYLDRIDAALKKRGQKTIVVYDHLDKIGLLNLEVRRRATGSLLALWLSLSNRYTGLRCKIFAREDLFEAATRRGADASKLRGRSVLLTWQTSALYRLLIRHMAATSGDLADWIQETGKGIALTQHPHLGPLPPSPLPEEGRGSVRHFTEHLVGRYMGRGPKKGYVHNWIPNHLADAHGAISPRALLALVQAAAEKALERGPQARYHRLLHPSELVAASFKTSKIWVDQLAEDHPVVARLANLHGEQLPMTRKHVIRELSKPIPNQDDGFQDDGEGAFAELETIGVFSVRQDGRIDVPDIYRHGHGMKRKGGSRRR